QKFQRDGIQVKTGSMVTKVSDKEISLKERSTGETKNLPYGMVVWSTGIGTRPVITDFMKQIGQVASVTFDLHLLLGLGSYLITLFSLLVITTRV
ncbi:putative NADH:ubiquinone reductase, partial [Tanacetum coccineum]